MGCKAPGLSERVAAGGCEGDAHPSVLMGCPRGAGGSVISLLSPLPSTAPDGGCAINREASGCAALPGAVAFQALLVGDGPPQHSLVLQESPPWGAGCRWVPLTSSLSITSGSAAPGPEQTLGYGEIMGGSEHWGWQRYKGHPPELVQGAGVELHTLWLVLLQGRRSRMRRGENPRQVGA